MGLFYTIISILQVTIILTNVFFYKELRSTQKVKPIIISLVSDIIIVALSHQICIGCNNRLFGVCALVWFIILVLDAKRLAKVM